MPVAAAGDRLTKWTVGAWKASNFFLLGALFKSVRALVVKQHASDIDMPVCVRNVLPGISA